MSNYINDPMYHALLAACRANLSDDLARLVLADWLDEQGESERAEFIRVSINQPEWSIDWIAEGQRAMRLFGARCLWLSTKNLGSYFVWNEMDIWFNRGFICRVRCTQAQWLQHAGEIARHAVLERVELTDVTVRPLAGGLYALYALYIESEEDVHWRLFNIMREKYYPLGLVDSPHNTFAITFDTREAALEALSQTCIAYAYQQQQGVTV